MVHDCDAILNLSFFERFLKRIIHQKLFIKAFIRYIFNEYKNSEKIDVIYK